MKSTNSKKKPLQAKDGEDKKVDENGNADAFSGKEETPSGLHGARQKELRHEENSLHISEEDKNRSGDRS